VSRKNSLFTHGRLAENRAKSIEGTRENGRAYDKCASGGSFLSIDPVVTDMQNASSFNRYVYAKNSPYRYIDPDGRGALSIEGYYGFGGGISLGYSNGEVAITVDAGAGIGGGFQIDPRSGENGRMSPSGTTPTTWGVSVAGFAKVGAEVGTPIGTAALGMKVVGG
jgi:RHS repeat-associated protein